jgi:hypothetical protein
MAQEHLATLSDDMSEKDAITGVERETKGKLSQFRNRVTGWLSKATAMTSTFVLMTFATDAQLPKESDVVAKNTSKKVVVYKPGAEKKDTVAIWSKEVQEKIILDGKELTADEMKIYNEAYKDWKDGIYDSEEEFTKAWQKAVRDARELTALKNKWKQLDQTIFQLEDEIKKLGATNKEQKEKLQQEGIKKWKELTGRTDTYDNISQYLKDWTALEKKQQLDIITITTIQNKTAKSDDDKKIIADLFNQWTAYKHVIPQLMKIRADMLKYFTTDYITHS